MRPWRLSLPPSLQILWPSIQHLRERRGFENQRDYERRVNQVHHQIAVVKVKHPAPGLIRDHLAISDLSNKCSPACVAYSNISGSTAKMSREFTISGSV